MGAKESAETRKGLALLAKGLSVREAAKKAGVAPSTLTRAKARHEAAEVARLAKRRAKTPKE